MEGDDKLDVYSVFEPILRTSRLLGVLPVSLRRRRDGKRSTYERSAFAMIYGFILISSGIISVLLGYSNASHIFSHLVSQEQDGAKGLFVNMLEYVISVIISLGNIFFTFTCIPRIKSIFACLSKVDWIFRSTPALGGIVPRHRFLRRVASLQALTIFSVGTAAAVIDSQSFGRGNPAYWSTMPFYFLRALSLCVEQQFVQVALLFRERFILINSVLLNSTPISDPLWSITTDYRSGRVGPSQEKTRDAELLETLRIAHALLSEEISTVNRAYQVPLLVDIIMLFTDFIAGGYFLISSLLEGREVLASAISWTTISSLRIALISGMAWDMTGKANMTGRLIVKLLRRKMKPESKEELNIFLTQLSRIDTRLNILGLFYLDMTLPQAMTQAATSYLLILIQFKPSE